MLYSWGGLMSVIRVNHQKDYVVINKKVLEDPVLSFKAKGLWAYCMSRPDHWQFHVSHLSTVSKDGEDAIYSALKELEKNGYLKKVQKNENGKFGPVDYEISENKEDIEKTPLRDFPEAVNPHAGNPALVSNDIQLLSTYIPPLPPPKKMEPEPEMTYTEEEDEFFKKVLKERKGPVIRSVSRYKKAVILDKRAQEMSDTKSASNTNKRIEMAKQIYEHSLKRPDLYAGKISIDSLGILSCTGKGINLLPLSPRESTEDWLAVIESWKRKK